MLVKKGFKQQEIENTSHSQQTQIFLSVKTAKERRKRFNFSYLLKPSSLIFILFKSRQDNKNYNKPLFHLQDNIKTWNYN